MRSVRSIRSTAESACRRCTGVFLLVVAIGSSPIAADSILLGDISFQPDTPVTGLDSIFLDNFTDLADLGCSPSFPACPGLDISGTLTFVYLNSSGATQNGSIAVGSTGPGSRAIYEFDPTQMTLESAVFSGAISPATFLLDDGTTFASTGAFISDTLTPNASFANISVSANETSPVPEPAGAALLLVGSMTLGAAFLRRRLA